MSLKNLPLDVGRLGVALCVAVDAKVDPETGVIKTDKEGRAVWTVGVAVRPEGRKTALIEVAVSGEPAGVEVGQVVSLVGLEAFWWEMNGRAGLSFRADSVVLAAAGVRPVASESRAAGGGGAK
ncbi:SCO3933 family regulatory protein [Kitasatospora sp. NPDC001574]